MGNIFNHVVVQTDGGGKAAIVHWVGAITSKGIGKYSLAAPKALAFPLLWTL